MTFRGRKDLLLALVLSSGVVMTAACGGGGYATSPSQPSGGGATGATAVAADVTITIMGMNGENSFSPNPGGAAVGQTVAWRNADTVAHTATGTGFDTGAIAPGATSAPIRFEAAATYAYRCTMHPDMTGSLKVGDSNDEIGY